MPKVLSRCIFPVNSTQAIPGAGTNAWRLEDSPDLDHRNPRQETRLSFLLQHSSRRCQVSLLDPTTASPSQPTSNFFSVQALDSTRPGRFCDCTSCPNPPSPAASLSTFCNPRPLAQLTASTSDFLCSSRPGPKLHQRQSRQLSLRQDLCHSLYLFSCRPFSGSLIEGAATAIRFPLHWRRHLSSFRRPDLSGRRDFSASSSIRVD